jgi:flagellar motor switch protein FliG
LTPAGRRKAALFLMQIGPEAAAKLLSAVGREIATEIVSEIALLNATGKADRQQAEDTVRGFYTLLRGEESDWGLGFIKQVLGSALGPDDSERAFKQVKDSLDQYDPFGDIRTANVYEIVEALEGEPAQLVAVVLSELPERSSRELLSLLDEEMSNKAICGMAGATLVPAATKVRVANGIRRRLEEIRMRGGEGGNVRERQIRKAAVLLRGLGKELRQKMLKAIGEHDPDTGALVQKMIVIWEDIPIIGDRSLQEVLRQVDLRQLAVAMYNCDQRIGNKIKKNMSEGARATVYEESELMTAPKAREIREAREAILQELRSLNEAGLLDFEGE